MRPVPWAAIEPHRIQVTGYESRHGDPYGAFRIPYPPTASKLAVLAVSGDFSRAHLGDAYAWDHVSVSLVAKARTPNWSEMSFIKEMFWLPDETVMQLHVPASDHVNIHTYTLHLWRPLLIEIPRPPQGAV